MKTRISIWILLIGLAVPFSSCENKKSSQVITIIVDLTEKYFRHISIDDFRKVSVITKNSTNYESVRISPVTELGFNEVKTLKIDSVGTPLLANDYERKKEIQKYFTGIASTLQEFTKEKRERDGSVIYKILSEELNKLSESRAELKKLIINCDLNEKSFINFYDTAVLNSIRNKPEEMRKLLIEKYPLKNLTGIEVFIVYKPQDIYDNERFEIVSNFYKEMLESYGAHVTISGSL